MTLGLSLRPRWGGGSLPAWKLVFRNGVLALALDFSASIKHKSPVCGILLGQPRLTKTGRQGAGSREGGTQHVKGTSRNSKE